MENDDIDKYSSKPKEEEKEKADLSTLSAESKKSEQKVSFDNQPNGEAQKPNAQSEDQTQDESLLAAERLEREKQEKFLKRNSVIKHNMLFIIPSWSALLGYPTLGKYVGQNVSKIVKDIVIFFGGTECAVETETGVNYFLFGPGYHYLKFELQEGKYITDSRQLTGLMISDFVYDLMASSSNVTLEQDKDVIIADKVIKIPLDLSNKTDNQKTFIKGAIMRNIFIPNKEIILEMMDKIKNPQNFRLKDSGHLLMSATEDHFNEILVSENMKMYESKGYMNSTAGLNDINYGVDKILNKLLSPVEQEVITKNFNKVLHTYANLQFDPVYPFSIIENVQSVLPPDDYHPAPPKEQGLKLKESVLMSAEERIDDKKEWPKKFKRKKIEEKKTPKIQVKQSSEMYDMDTLEPTDRPIPETEDYRESREDFELRILKNPKVEIKAVPNAPTGDAEEIFYYLKYVLEENFDMPSIGRAFEMARDNLRKISLQSELDKKPYQNEMWEMSKTSNIYQKEKAGYGLNERDKTAVLEKVDSWIEVIKKKREEEERKKRERLERERKERERKEQERLEKERREKERKERERLEKEKREREKREKVRLEKERKEREKELERAKEEKAKAEALAKEEKIAQTKLEAESDQAKKSALKKPLGIAFLLSLITNIILVMYIILIS